jgi:hypothetical protein
VTLRSSGNFTCAHHVINTVPSAAYPSHPLLGLLRSCGSPLTASHEAQVDVR